MTTLTHQESWNTGTVGSLASNYGFTYIPQSSWSSTTRIGRDPLDYDTRVLEHGFTSNTASSWYGGLHFPNTYHTNGDEIWFKTNLYFATDWSWAHGSGGGSDLKLMRIYPCQGNHNVYTNIAVEKCCGGVPGHIRSMSFEFKHLGWASGYDTYANTSRNNAWTGNWDDYELTLGKWHTFEIYIKLGSNGVMRTWLNEKLVIERYADVTIVPADPWLWHGTFATFGHTWEALPPKNQTAYSKNWVLTSDPDWIRSNGTQDADGNWMVGSGTTIEPGTEPEPEPVPVIEPVLKDPDIANLRVENITASEATIMWNTDIPSNSVVSYDTESGKEWVRNDDFTLEHTIILYDLQPDTVYTYALSSRTATGETTLIKDKSFTTGSVSIIEEPVVEEPVVEEPVVEEPVVEEPVVEEPVVPPVTANTSSIGIAIDNSDNPHIAFYNADINKIIYYKKTNAGWIREELS